MPRQHDIASRGGAAGAGVCAAACTGAGDSAGAGRQGCRLAAYRRGAHVCQSTCCDLCRLASLHTIFDTALLCAPADNGQQQHMFLASFQAAASPLPASLPLARGCTHVALFCMPTCRLRATAFTLTWPSCASTCRAWWTTCTTGGAGGAAVPYFVAPGCRLPCLTLGCWRFASASHMAACPC